MLSRHVKNTLMAPRPPDRIGTNFVPTPREWRIQEATVVGCGLRLTVLLALLLTGSTAVATDRATRLLTFEDRVNAQEAIERVYYRHQLGTTKPFEQAVPRAVIETKVRTYLKETSALERLWSTPVTGEMLDRELRRMVGGTRMPDRLRELYAALGNDPVLILECLARPSLVNRLSRNFFDYDGTIHGRARAEAESIRTRLASGELRTTQADARRTVVDLTRDPSPEPSGSRLQVRPDRAASLRVASQNFDRAAFELPRMPGEVGAVIEGRDCYSISVLLERDTGHLRAATYKIEKRTWEDWWSSVEAELSLTVRAPASAGTIGRVDIATPTVPACPTDDTWEPTLDDAPEWRTGHSAVWTGSEMIVWGGYKPFFALNHPGLRYDPATDTWAPISSLNAPVRVYGDEVAVWAGDRMIVLSGSNAAYDPATDSWTPLSLVNAPSGANKQNTAPVGNTIIVWSGLGVASGRRYSPATDTWTTLPALNEPSPRQGHTVVSTGTGVIVWGGSSGDFTDSGGVYDLALDSWSATSTVGAPMARTAHTATWTADKRMIVWGGYGADGNVRNDGGLYDPTTDAWSPMSMAGAPTPRTNHSAVWGAGKLLIWGGSDWSSPTLGTGGRYDPATDSWTSITTTNAPPPRTEQIAIWTGDRMIVWGGQTGGDHTVNSGGRYDPFTDSWTPTSVGSSPLGRAIHTAVWTGTTMIVWGGYDELAPGPLLNSGGRYDPTTDAWSPTSTFGAPLGRSSHTAVWTGSEMVVWGGYAGYPTDFVNSGGRYDPVTDTWSATSVDGAPAAGPGLVSVWTGNVMVIWAGSGPASRKYDPALNLWSPISTSGAPAAAGVAVWTGSVVVVWGRASLGVGGGRYDPVADTWSPISAVNAPSPRDAATAVWTGNEMIVWGGLDGIFNAFDTGGRYDPVTDVWTPTSTVNAPERRYEHTAIWTGREMIVWGGLYRYPDFQNSGGRYDPAADTWVPTSSDNVPSARHQHTAVWTGDAMVVFGGFGSEAGREEFSSGGRYYAQYDQDIDGDGYTACEGDCDDDNPDVYPGAPQLCDRINNDCSDPNWPVLPSAEADLDGDSFPICQGDCDDTRASVFPGASPLCDGVNNACGSPNWPSLTKTNEADDDGDSFTECMGDCNDSDPLVRPGAPDACGGIDTNCDRLEYDSDHDGWTGCQGDCNDDAPDIYPGATERCNWIDDDCDGTIDTPACDVSCDPNAKIGEEVRLTFETALNNYTQVPLVAWNGSRYGVLRKVGYAQDGYYFGIVDRFGRRIAADRDFGYVFSTAPEQAALAASPGMFGFAWFQNRSVLIFSRVLADGAVAGPDVTVVPFRDAETRNPTLAWDGSAFVLAWQDRVHSPYRIKLRRISEAGVLLGTETLVSAPGLADSTDPSIACGNAECGIAWVDSKDGDSAIYVAQTDHDGAVVGLPRRLTAPGSMSSSPALTRDFRGYSVAWVEKSSGSDELYFAGVDHAGQVVVPPHRVSAAPGLMGFLSDPKLASTGAEFRLTWLEFLAGVRGVKAARLDLEGNPLGPFVSIRTGNVDTASPDSAWAGSELAVVWTEKRSTGPWEYYFARFGSSCADGDGDGIAASNDCDDASASVAPGAPELCDGVANDCRSASWPAAPALEADIDQDGFRICADDCNDANAGVHPGAADRCNGLDDDCDGVIDNAETAVCDDGDLCTTGESCQSGVCVAASSGLNHPDPKSSGYYRMLCLKRDLGQLPYQGDQLTNADAACVGQLTATFAGSAVVDDICDVIDGGPQGGECAKGDDELMAIALNVCRARICEEQRLDSHCQGNSSSSVHQSFSDADAILSDPGRDGEACRSATCELREINNGHALELNSLLLAFIKGRALLEWSPPVLDDGSGTPSFYEVWRRAARSNEPFAKIGTTTGLTFLDPSMGTANVEYRITAVIAAP